MAEQPLLAILAQFDQASPLTEMLIPCLVLRGEELSYLESELGHVQVVLPGRKHTILSVSCLPALFERFLTRSMLFSDLPVLFL